MESVVVEIDGSEKLVPLRKDGLPLLVGRSRTADIRLHGRSISGFVSYDFSERFNLCFTDLFVYSYSWRTLLASKWWSPVR
jgi:hypothetical protein